MNAAARLEQFKPAWRKRIVHGALVAAGSWFIAHAMMARFTAVARSAHGYTGPEVYKPQNLMQALRDSGHIQKWCARFTHGWDPWSLTPMPKSLMVWYVQTKRGTTFHALRSRTGNFGTLKKKIRAWAKQTINATMKNWIEDGNGFAKLPWVRTGELREAATRARPVARTTRAGEATLRIVIPRTHALSSQDAQAFTRFTAPELTRMVAIVKRSIGISLRTGVPAGKTGQLQPSAPHRTHLMELLARSRKAKGT